MRLNKEVRRSARSDRKAWLTDLAANGDWQSLKKLKQGKRVAQGRLADANGDIVESSERAERFAEYLETVQWAVRPARLVDRPNLYPELEVHQGPVLLPELVRAVMALRDGKASGPDDVPIEYWKALLGPENDSVTKWLPQLCNTCLEHGTVPHDWHRH